MANVAQTITCGQNGVGDNTASEYILLDGGGVGILPVGKHVHRGSFVLDGTTGSDTASLRLTLPLASNIVWQLRTFMLVIETSTDWVRGMFEYFYAPSTTAFGGSTQLNYNMQNCAFIDLGTSRQPWFIAQSEHVNGEAASWCVADDRSSPYNMLTYKDLSAGADPVVALSTGAGNPVTEGGVRFACTWLAYTYDQMNNSMLHAGLNNRN